MRLMRWVAVVLMPAAMFAGATLAQDMAEPAMSAIPEGVQQSGNAGSMNVTIPSSGSSETVTETHSSSSSFSISTPADTPSGSGSGSLVPQLGNAPPPWVHKHQNQNAAGGVVAISPGPIWNNGDAKNKCPAVCAKASMSWTGDWRTTGPNQSECDCVGAGGQSAMAGGRGTSCSAPQNYQCAGCSVSCPAGLQASCKQGERGIFTSDSDSICPTRARCECR